jgi:prevent-host-death family protein
MIDVCEAQAQLAELLVLVAAGTEIILTADSTPLARIVSMAKTPPPRVAGLHPGAMWTSEDFDEPLPEEFWSGTP